MDFIVIEQEDQLAAHIQANSKLIIIFGAKWCKNCSKLQDSLKLNDKLSSIYFAKVDIDETADIADAYGVSAIPHVTFLYNGSVARNYVGSNIEKVVEYYDELNSVDAASAELTTSQPGPLGNASGAVEPTLFAIQELPSDFSYTLRPLQSRSLCFELLNSVALGALPVTGNDVLTAMQSDVVGRALARSHDDLINVESLFVYKVPMVSEDGTCSKADMMAKRPFNLATDAYHITNEADWDPAALVDHPTTRRLAFLNRVVTKLNEIIRADWLGIYRLVLADGEPALLKEAYFGEPSRPVFPVTATFAQKSTNSWVGLTGNVRIIDNTHIRDGSVSYYECSNKVQSELCAPIFGPYDASVGGCPIVGIIDAESWNQAHFTSAKVLHVLQVCLELGRINFGFDLV